MPGYSVTTLPPGSSLFFLTDGYDDLGNDIYTGEYIIIGPHGETLPAPVPPSYASAPKTVVTKVIPSVPPGPPGSKIFNEQIRESVRAYDGGVRKISSGRLPPAVISGWVDSENAKRSDNLYATDYSFGDEYTSILEASGFDFSSIPADAVITGIKVHVERSKVPDPAPPAPPEPPSGDFFLVSSGAATFKSAEGIADLNIADFLAIDASDFIEMSTNEGIYSGFNKDQFTDFNGNFMNGYPVFVRENDPDNVIYDYGNDGSKIVVGHEPADGSGSRLYYLESWLDQNVWDWSYYGSLGGRFTKTTDGLQLIFTLPQTTGSTNPYLRRSLDGSMGRVLSDGESLLITSGMYHIRELEEISLDPYQHMRSKSDNVNYIGFSIFERTMDKLTSNYVGGWQNRWHTYHPAIDGKLYYSIKSGNLASISSGNAGDGTPEGSGFAAGGAFTGSVGSFFTQVNVLPIIDNDGRTWIVQPYASNEGIEFKEYNPTVFTQHTFGRALDAREMPSTRGFVLADNTMVFIGNGGFGENKSILYGHPDTGFTFISSSDINGAPFAGLTDPSVGQNANHQRCRRFNLAF